MADGILGGGGIKGAESDVIGASLSGDHGEMPRIVAGDADDGIVADQGARLVIGGIVLAHVNPVAAGLGGEIGAVVQEEGDIAGLGDRGKGEGGLPDGVVVDALETKLDAGDLAGIQGQGQGIGEGAGI